MTLREALRGVIAAVRSDAATTRNYDTANICNGFALDLENLLAQTTDEPCSNCTTLRAALAERDAKIREFVRRLPVEMFATTNMHYWGKDLQERAEGLENVKRLLRELGLVTESDAEK